MGEDEKSIREMVAAWMKMTKEGDVEGVLGLMSEEVVFLVPGREPFGKAEFAAGSRAMAGMKIEGANEIMEIEVMGEWAWMWGKLNVNVTMGTETGVRRGTVMTILRKEGGKWVVYRDANMLAME